MEPGFWNPQYTGVRNLEPTPKSIL